MGAREINARMMRRVACVYICAARARPSGCEWGKPHQGIFAHWQNEKFDNERIVSSSSPLFVLRQKRRGGQWIYAVSCARRKKKKIVYGKLTLITMTMMMMIGMVHVSRHVIWIFSFENIYGCFLVRNTFTAVRIVFVGLYVRIESRNMNHL